MIAEIRQRGRLSWDWRVVRWKNDRRFPEAEGNRLTRRGAERAARRELAAIEAKWETLGGTGRAA